PALNVIYSDELLSLHQLNAHSTWLQVTCDSGALGAAGFVLFLVLGLAGVLGASRRAKGLDRAVAVGSFGGLVVLLLAGFFSVSMDAEPGILLFSLMALGNVPAPAARQASEKDGA
ncbi:MAG: hypothetical protein KAW67_00795, partial [Candidatus Eisenbacteria sp.]|nr:hypothetical protein [Candidatus Eisenbacteria bacterium]